MKSSTLLYSALVALAALASPPARADNMASIAIAPANGAVTLTPRWAIGGSLAGFHFMSQDWGLTGGAANQFYSIKSTAIPSGGDTLAYNFYVAGSGAATPHADIGSKLTPNSYSALTSADPDVGFGSVNQYLIHHKGSTDYFTVIKPGAAAASTVTDLKPMSGPGGPATVTGVSGYFGLTFAAANLGYGLNVFYYLRTDSVTGFTKFGSLVPALAGTGTDLFNLGIGGHNALAFTGDDVGFGADKMYYLRLDPVTGFTILGTLHPVTGRASDIANLGSVYSTLTYVPGDVGFGSSLFYTTGTVNPTWQSVSFAAIADRLVSAGSFTVAPSASSGLPIVLTVVSGSTGAATISAPVAGVFTITPTVPGVITLQATQAGQVAPTAYESNMLRQSFTATGVPIVTNSPLTAAGTVGTPFSFAITAAGTPTSYTASPLPAGLSIAAATGIITGTPTTVGTTPVLLGATNAIGTGNATLTITVAAAGVAPIITNSPLTAAGTVGTPFSFTITASGTPTSYTAAPLPAGLSIVAATGIITGTPTTVGPTAVLLGATNASGTGNATLTITVAAAGAAPIISNSPLTAAGTVGTPFSFTITASGSPTSYTASPLPAGLSIVAATGVITGTPTTVGTTSVGLGATNTSGTGHVTLTITVAAAGVAPIITNSPLTAAGTVGTPFSFVITASGLPASYTASPLPAGLSIVAATGAITGTPTTVGPTAVLLGATNASGTGHATLTITIVAADVAPTITNTPLTAPGTVGTPFSFVITAAGNPTSYSAVTLPAGLTLVTATGAITGTPTTVGTTSVVLGATNSTGTGNATLLITIVAQPVAPLVTTNPASQTGTAGGFVTFTAGGSGTPEPTYQWYHDGVLIPGATGTTLTLTELRPTDAGAYTATITNASGTVTTAPAILKVTSSRITNFSARALSGPGDQTLIMGFVVSGYGKHLLIRGVGPTLASYGVTNPLADPMLTLYGRNGAVATNDNWQISSTGANQGVAIAATAVEVGAFPLPDGSKDAALLFAVDDGAHTTSMLRPNGATGVALTEIYDTDTELGARLVNVSARMNVTAGDGTLIAGLVIAGDAPKTVLIRGVGPTLAAYGVTGAMADPKITVFSGSTEVAANDNWEVGTSTPAAIMLVSAQVGAFALPPGSKDAALIITLRPGSYSVHVTGASTTTGVALVEVYDTQ